MMEFPCPKGRVCPAGSGGYKDEYDRCVKNATVDCNIGDACPNDYFCAEMTWKVDDSIKCPPGTLS
jgi:hypothetical protein